MSIFSRSGSSAASVRSFASTIPSVTTPDQDADILPSYTSLYPNQTTSTTPDTANLMRDRREIPRYTTITLREIRFPSGCPCHPKNPSAGREALRQERIALARAACDRPQHSPPSIVPDSTADTTSTTTSTPTRSRLSTRERTTSASSTSSTRTTHPATTTTSQCATSLGLEVIAVDQHSQINENNNNTPIRNGSSASSSSDPQKLSHDSGTGTGTVAYRTTPLKWWECMVTLPPKFLLLSGDVPGSTRSGDERHEVSVAVAKISRPPFMNLPPGNRAWIEMASGKWGAGRQRQRQRSQQERLSWESEVAKEMGETRDSGGGGGETMTRTASLCDVTRWEIRQRGFKRLYNFYPVTGTAGAGAGAGATSVSAPFAAKNTTGPDGMGEEGQDEGHARDAAHTKTESDTGRIFTWKGSHSILASLPGSAAEDHGVQGDGQQALPECHGNLKLVDSRGKVLAAWRQQRGKKVLGRLYVFDEFEDEDEEKAGEEGLDVDVVVATCLYVVVVERILWTTFVGG